MDLRGILEVLWHQYGKPPQEEFTTILKISYPEAFVGKCQIELPHLSDDEFFNWMSENHPDVLERIPIRTPESLVAAFSF